MTYLISELFDISYDCFYDELAEFLEGDVVTVNTTLTYKKMHGLVKVQDNGVIVFNH